MKDKRVLPPTYLLVAVIIMLVLHFLFPGSMIISSPWNLLGLVPLVCGVVINLIADRAFRLAGTTVKPFEETNALITTGVYRISRHPMYLGFVLILIGLAALVRSLTTWIVIPVFIVVVDYIFIRMEEHMIETKFGRDWSEYKQKVRRWI